MRRVFGTALLLFIILGTFTVMQVRGVPNSLRKIISKNPTNQLLDRHGMVLTVHRGEQWNKNNYIELEHIPKDIIEVFVTSEDKRFYHHSGVDWLARFHALSTLR